MSSWMFCDLSLASSPSSLICNCSISCLYWCYSILTMSVSIQCTFIFIIIYSVSCKLSSVVIFKDSVLWYFVGWELNIPTSVVLLIFQWTAMLGCQWEEAVVGVKLTIPLSSSDFVKILLLPVCFSKFALSALDFHIGFTFYRLPLIEIWEDCEGAQSRAIEILTPSPQLTYIGMFGDSNPLNISEWIQLINSTAPTSITDKVSVSLILCGEDFDYN